MYSPRCASSDIWDSDAGVVPSARFSNAGRFGNIVVYFLDYETSDLASGGGTTIYGVYLLLYGCVCGLIELVAIVRFLNLWIQYLADFVGGFTFHKFGAEVGGAWKIVDIDFEKMF